MERILVVDDDSAILFLVSTMITKFGYETLLARSGFEALELVDHADLVVTDLCMPGLDGLELLSLIRQRDEMLPVILVTGLYCDALAERALRAGAFRCLPKPFELQQLDAAIAAALEARREATTGPRALAV